MAEGDMSNDPKKQKGEIREKLVRTKERWAAEGRGLTEAGTQGQAHERLPPGQRLVTDWPVLDLGVVPELDAGSWSLTVDGEVAHALKWDWQSLIAQPQIDFVSDIHCVTTWSRYDNHWQGVAARHLIEQAGVRDTVKYVALQSYDGYTTNLTLEAFASPDVLLAHSWQGQPLSLEHGGPVRLVVPQSYFWKSPKWLKRITFSATDKPGFWEERGYHNEGDPWREERYG